MTLISLYCFVRCCSVFCVADQSEASHKKWCNSDWSEIKCLWVSEWLTSVTTDHQVEFYKLATIKRFSCWVTAPHPGWSNSRETKRSKLVYKWCSNERNIGRKRGRKTYFMILFRSHHIWFQLCTLLSSKWDKKVTRGYFCIDGSWKIATSLFSKILVFTLECLI